MKKRSSAVLACVVGIVAAFPSSAGESDPFNWPRILVTARAGDGGMLSCVGSACAGVISGMTVRSPYQTELTLEAETGLDRADFCAALKSKQPANCNSSNPPSTPGLDPNWQPNGCGTGGMSNLLLDSGMEVLLSDTYSGNFQAPYPGVSFRSACDAHDACWGVAGSRAVCDTAFHNAMEAACGVVSQAAARTTCNGFASAYFSAVAITNIGNSNYQRATENRRCALWAQDVKANGCG